MREPGLGARCTLRDVRGGKVAQGDVVVCEVRVCGRIVGIEGMERLRVHVNRVGKTNQDSVST